MEKESNKQTLRSFFADVLKGTTIGAAFIIPGFSGGSIAAIIGIYEKLINSIADIFKDFKRSFMTLLPIAIGMVIGIVGLLFPLGWALDKFPFPTVSLFVGLAIGGMPSITDKVKGNRIKLTNIAACLLPLLLALSLSFIPIGADKNLFDLTLGGYVILFLIGVIGSSALVIPGISGSMLLLILGYYNPIVDLATNHLFRGKDVLTSVLVLGCTGVGIILGFLLISVIMKILFKKCPRGTYFAIIGFIVGSIPSIFISTAKEAGVTLSTLPSSVFHWICCAVLLAVGFAASYMLVIYSRKNNKA